MSLAQLSGDWMKRVRRDEPMSKHTSWHVGGPADLYFEPRDVDDLAAFLRSLPGEVAVTWLGLGSNLLVRDGGIRGAVIATSGALGRVDRISQTRVHCEAGVPCARLAKLCIKWGLGPAEFFGGIPGTMGGALAMNAGAFGGETWRHVVEVDTISRDGRRATRTPADFEIGYRRVAGPENEWFLAARLEFEQQERAGDADLRQMLARRKQTQPIGEWSCGSVFTNPQGDHAARLIDSAGLKGFAIGGASVSTKHANFIINHGGASATDIESLIAHVRSAVEKAHGVRLEPEVRVLGERR
ncbi:MAG TPA: UDP-N-acetylmuramate dehydrogenase [Steroidobacteraceae bacterium]|nr:UDP-N-acetylmuramate dehydrogenase [Steroidobacteraceae bacterium]